MNKYTLKTHLIKKGKVAYCGAIMTPLRQSTELITKTTCLVCKDKNYFDKGKLPKWKIGGRNKAITRRKKG